MNVEGRYLLDAPPEIVYRAICDPATLMAVIPGCDGIEQAGPDEYRGRITLRLPGMVGSYRTLVRLVDAVPPHSAGMAGAVDGGFGSISGRADFTLTPQGTGTCLEYRGTAVIDGPLARLDSRFAQGLAETLIGQGLRSLNQRLVATSSTAVTVDGRVAGQPSREASE